MKTTVAMDKDVADKVIALIAGRSFSAKIEQLIDNYEKVNISLEGKRVDERLAAQQILIESGILHHRTSERIINVLWELVFALAQSIKPDALSKVLAPQFKQIVEDAELEKSLYPDTDVMGEGSIWLTPAKLKEFKDKYE